MTPESRWGEPSDWGLPGRGVRGLQKIRTTPSGLGIGAAQRVGGFSTLGDPRIGDYRLQGRVRDTGSGAGLAIQSSRVRGPQPDWHHLGRQVGYQVAPLWKFCRRCARDASPVAPLRGTGPMVGKLSRLGHFEVLSFGFGMKFRPWDQSGSGLAPLGVAGVVPLSGWHHSGSCAAGVAVRRKVWHRSARLCKRLSFGSA